MRIELTHDEKVEVLGIVKAWKRKQITQDRLRSIQKETGIPARSIEIMFWHYDSLSLFENVDSFTFKGGTCVQSWLPGRYQRASVDLDFNSMAGNPNSIKDIIEDINMTSIRKGRTAEIRGINFGSIEFMYTDDQTGTMTFIRRMPTRFNEMIKVGNDSIQGIDQRIQINFKNAWLPAIKPISKDAAFIIVEFERPEFKTNVIHSSVEDLIADKILATCNVHGFGRERFKDVYDLEMLLDLDRDNELIMKKLSLIAQKKGVDPLSFIEGSVETISRISDRSQEARGFASMVGKGGRERIIPSWEMFCLDVIERIRSIKTDINRKVMNIKMEKVEESPKDKLLDIDDL
ncbi:MAG: nucleotidyl transferase AbiEii/AbiGii toxin family protein [Thermoplasmatota archaeon]